MPRAANTFRGAPCKDCGSALRYVRNNTCVQCARAYSRMEYAMFSEQRRGMSREWREANKERHNEMMRAGQLRRKFGITPEQYDAIAAAQDKLCAVCRKVCITDRKLAVD